MFQCIAFAVMFIGGYLASSRLLANLESGPPARVEGVGRYATDEEINLFV